MTTSLAGQQFVERQDGGAAGVAGWAAGGDARGRPGPELGDGGPADPAEPDDPAGQRGQPAQPGAGRVPAARADLAVGGDQARGSCARTRPTAWSETSSTQ